MSTMKTKNPDERFLQYQARAIRRYQRLHRAKSPDEAETLALEWVARFAGRTRATWERLTNRT
jgi:hypothetical protein